MKRLARPSVELTLLPTRVPDVVRVAVGRRIRPVGGVELFEDGGVELVDHAALLRIRLKPEGDARVAPVHGDEWSFSRGSVGQRQLQFDQLPDQTVNRGTGLAELLEAHVSKSR
jgi:hypothetical protein